MFYGAVTKGGAAANHLTSNVRKSSVNDYMLLYNLDEPPVSQLADQIIEVRSLSLSSRSSMRDSSPCSKNMGKCSSRT